MTIELSKIGERLRKARERRKMSPTKASVIARCSVATIWRAERGEIKDIEKLSHLCDIYGVSLREVLFGVEPADLADIVPSECRQFFIELGELLNDKKGR